ncbi:DNA mismatch repair protein Msh6-2 [Hibiscus syriacus]|uniref:DNA mismatch repair protein Msh6-2 n=1 Tax=Hibiscus syriacus TaxID=106335 RepID=A0A6A2X738_HIBSY|nr:trihelix transcription factor ASIL2-like [Hibiscus syriacus]KAE8671143.1 DNA mismatch repair protein Msh6-2 [Hibiscus syriacus]
MDGLEPYSFNSHPQYPRSTRTRHVYSYGPDEELDDEEELEQENNNLDDDDDDDPDVYCRRVKERERFERYPKRQKLRTSVPSFQCTPDHRDSFKTAYDWSQQEIYVLLEVWGNRFLQLGRRSLRGEDWVDVAEKVSDALKSVKNEAQCRRMIDGLKRKFKKKKLIAERIGLNSSKWVFFRKMEMLMGLGSSFKQQESWLACGVDSGEFVFMNPQVYLDRSNGFDEMRDSPTDSENEEEEDGEEADGESRVKAEVHDEHSMRILADSVLRFGKIYEKIESSKREHMNELEKMRTDFHQELEVQKKQILERAQAEIAKLKEEDDDDEDETDDEYEDNENSMQNISE